MKNKILISITVFLFLFVGTSFSQVFSFTGFQTKGTAGNNAKLECVSFTTNKTVTVISVTGDNLGFWIVKENYGIFKQYYKTNDVSVVGLKLNPGTYYLYPNLRNNQTKANVTLKLQ